MAPPISIDSSAAPFDHVVVSDAQQALDQELESGFAFGTAVRATDILMHRINQLEVQRAELNGVIGSDPSTFIYVDIRQLIEPDMSDPHIRHLVEPDNAAPHPPSINFQRFLRRVRTDLDAFTPVEITALVQHGYRVARRTLLTKGVCPAAGIPSNPWNPTRRDKPSQASSSATVPDNGQDQGAATQLRDAASRKARILAWRDPVSYFLLAGMVLAFFVPLAVWYIGGVTVAHAKYAFLDIVSPPKQPWAPMEPTIVPKLPDISYITRTSSSFETTGNSTSGDGNGSTRLR